MRISDWSSDVCSSDLMKAAHMRGVTMKGFGDLDRQFARRRQHQRLWRAIRQFNARQDRQCECGGFAGAGLRLAEHIVAVEQVRNGLRLNRRRRFVADRLQRRENRSEAHTSELQSLMRTSYAVFCLKKKKT